MMESRRSFFCVLLCTVTVLTLAVALQWVLRNTYCLDRDCLDFVFICLTGAWTNNHPVLL